MPFAEQEIYKAIRNNEFLPYFQPIVELRTGALEGFEILARWNHPTRGLIMPLAFIPFVERYRLMNELTTCLLTQAFLAAKGMPSTIGLSANISPSQLHDRTLPTLLARLAEDTSFDLRRLTAELTESALLDDLTLAGIIAADLKSLGMRLSLDDFGTGYSSLLHLQALPFDELKVDSSFVRSMVDSRDSRKITAAVVSLGQSLGLRTVGEGVEERSQAELLTWQGCDLGQGWLYGRAVPAGELAAIIAQGVLGGSPVASPSSESRVMARSLEAHSTARLSQLRAIYDGAPVGLCFLGCDLRYVNLNQPLADMNNLSVEAHLGHRVADILPDAFPAIDPYLQRALAGEAIHGVEMPFPPIEAGGAPRTLLVSYQPARDEAGEVVGISVSVADISAVKRSEAALHEATEDIHDQRRVLDVLNHSEALVRSILDSAPIGILMVDAASGLIVNANPRAEEQLGASLKPNIPWSDAPWVLYDDQNFPIEMEDLPLYRALRLGITSEAVEVRLNRKDGSTIWISLTAAPVRNAQGSIIGAILLMQDVDVPAPRRQTLRALAKKRTAGPFLTHIACVA